jgi:hypothetical protein
MNLAPFVERLRAERYQALAGTEAFVKLPLREALVNELLETAVLPALHRWRALRVAFYDDNLVDVVVTPSSRWLPSMTIPFEIEPHIAMLPSPTVRLHLRNSGILGRLGSLASVFSDRLPPGARFEDRVLEIDLATLLADKDGWHVLDLVRHAHMTTTRSTLWIEAALGVGSPQPPDSSTRA